MTRHLLVCPPVRGSGGRDEPVQTDLLAAPSPPRQLRTTTDARTYRRTLAVLELDRGRSAADIADMLGVTRQSVYNWAAAFAQDPAPDRPGRRRPERATSPPGRAGRRALLRSLMDAVAPGSRLPGHRLDRALAPAGVGEGHWAAALRRHRPARAPAAGLRLEAAPLRPRPRPRAAGEKNGASAGRSGGLPRRSVVLAEDETDLLLFPPLRAGWSPAGRARRRSYCAAGTPGGWSSGR